MIYFRGGSETRTPFFYGNIVVFVACANFIVVFMECRRHHQHNAKSKIKRREKAPDLQCHCSRNNFRVLCGMHKHHSRIGWMENIFRYICQSLSLTLCAEETNEQTTTRNNKYKTKIKYIMKLVPDLLFHFMYDIFRMDMWHFFFLFFIVYWMPFFARALTKTISNENADGFLHFVVTGAGFLAYFQWQLHKYRQM